MTGASSFSGKPWSVSECRSCTEKYVHKEKKRHVCGMVKCPSCQEHVSVAAHRCFIQPVDAEDGSDSRDKMANALLVYADIEATQMADRSFEPNLLCYRTAEEEDIHCLRGSDCCLQFLNELDALAEQLPESNSEDDDDEDDERPIVIIFHNLKGFDGIFILRELYRQQRTVTSQLTVGAKVLSFTSGPLVFKDSLCFLPMPLATFSGTFGITELKKGYFPHTFNTPENQSYVGRIPDIEYYDPEGMKDQKAKRVFEQWHADQVARGVEFDFQTEMEAYCQSDVALLQAGCEAFCTQFSSIAGFNPMIRCVTIAAACNLYWRQEHLAPECIAIEPLQGWHGARVNQSKAAFQWLYFQESLLPKEGASADRIKHARNGGESQIPVAHDSFFVDGFDPSTQTVYEFHGCLWHGCRSCFRTNRKLKARINGDRSLDEVRTATLVKINTLRREGYNVIEIWECEWKALLADKTTAEARFVSTLDLADPLIPRDAFFGGRTGAVCLYAKADEGQGEQIHYVDVTSLYPWVNKTATYPVGHPQIITSPPHCDIDRFFGIAHVDILPPPGLFHPVLPVRSGGKLTFPLCSACVGDEQASPLLARRYSCSHSDNERTLRGTWCTPEIQRAISKGYDLTAIHEVWHFPPHQQKKGLFADYVNTWLKLKQESGGWPGWCVTDEQKQQYLHQYREREGIELDPTHIRKNPGRKATAKLMLNSFWGKFGERQNKPQTEAISSPAKLFDKLTNAAINVQNLRLCNEDLLEVVFTHHDDNVPPSNKTNIFIAAFTTCWARLKLYDYLDLLGEQVLYYDTDSVIYRHIPSNPSVATGDFLGEMTNELEGDDYIVEFVSGGAKNYGYKTKNGKTECKVRGFTLNVRGAGSLNYEIMKANIINELEQPLDTKRTVAVTNPNHFKRDQTHKRIALVNQTKQYGLVFDKRVVDPVSKRSYPFGYARIDDDIATLVDLL